jgi:hypothetical protein
MKRKEENEEKKLKEREQKKIKRKNKSFWINKKKKI